MDHKEIAALMAGIAPIINEHIERRLSELSASLESKLIASIHQPERGERGEPGKDADPDLIRRIVADAIAAIPVPQDGKDGLDGKDGKDGKDGADGKDGKDADPELIERLVARAVAQLPPAKDGRDGLPGVPGRDGIDGKDGASGTDGKDGKDGFCFDDFHVEYDGDRKLSFVYSREQERKEAEFELPLPIDRGIWKQGEFRRGDAVTWGGSLWIAQRDTAEKPDTIDGGWRLAVKRGRDGKDGKDGKDGRPGIDGRPGRDLGGF